MTQSTTLVDAGTAQAVALRDDAPPAAASIVSRALLQTPEARVTWFSFAAGQELTAHTNSRRALIQVLTGACDFFFNDAWHRLEAGAWLHLPPNHPHAVRAPEPFTMTLTLCPPSAGSLSQP
jgi:quercetin dioxygenase-like cupin family protein